MLKKLKWWSLNLCKKKKKENLKVIENLMLCSKKLYPIESVKYSGLKIDANLSW